MIVIATTAQHPIENLIIYSEKINSRYCCIRGFNHKRRESWKLSDKKNKVVVKHFSGAKTKDMESYIIPNLEQNLETIIIHSWTNLETIVIHS